MEGRYQSDPPMKESQYEGNTNGMMEDDGKNGNDTSHFLVRYSQETSFSGLKYIGESGSFSRR